MSYPTWSLFLGTSDSPSLLITRHDGGLDLASTCHSSHFSFRTLASHISSLELHFLFCETGIITPALTTKIFVVRIRRDHICERVLQTAWHHVNYTEAKQGVILGVYIMWTRRLLVSILTLRTLQTLPHSLFFQPLHLFLPSSEMAHHLTSFVCLECVAKGKWMVTSKLAWCLVFSDHQMLSQDSHGWTKQCGGGGKFSFLSF